GRRGRTSSRCREWARRRRAGRLIAAGWRDGVPPRLPVLASRTPRSCNVPPQLQARAEAAEVAAAAPRPAFHGVAAPRTDTGIRWDAAFSSARLRPGPGAEPVPPLPRTALRR